jgi:glycosyltransferase involved in cell wall biosynthesis
LNSIVLYNWLANGVATTCKDVEAMIIDQAHLSSKRCRSIPTGVDPSKMNVDLKEVADFRKTHGISPEDCLIGTLCVLRSWKGVGNLLQAAQLLKAHPLLKWMVIGSGPMEERWKQECLAMGLQDRVIFTGYMDPPYTALQALDIFVLLSTANEGVSQASLQAAYLRKPLITTPTGGLKEVALEGETGFQVPVNDSHQVAEAVKVLANDPQLRKRYGENAHQLVLDKFTLQKTVDEMEAFYQELLQVN